MTDGQHPGLAAYRAALRLPGAARFSSAGALARLPQAMVGLGSVLLLTGLHRSYTLAGLVAGAISLAQCVTSPWISRLIDRRGQFRVLAPQLLAHLVSLALLVTAAPAAPRGGGGPPGPPPRPGVAAAGHRRPGRRLDAAVRGQLTRAVDGAIGRSPSDAARPPDAHRPVRRVADR